VTELFTKTRCSGQCCRDFNIRDLDYQALLQNAFKAIDKRDALEAAEPRDEAAIADAEAFVCEASAVASMVRPIVGPAPNKPDDPKEWRTEADHHFTCVYFDAASGNCTTYATRPYMCRDFPYGHACKYEGCEWEEGPAVTKLAQDAKRERQALALAGGERCGGDERLYSIRRSRELLMKMEVAASST
jgi:Fe-S-cluster containining protein